MSSLSLRMRRAPARNSFSANSCMSIALPFPLSAPELPDPFLREVMIEGSAPDGKAADHVADEGIAPGIPQHRLGLAAKLRRQFARPPSPPAAGPCRGQAGHGPLPDEVPLELGQRPEDVEHERAAGGGGVDPLGKRAEAEPPFLELPDMRISPLSNLKVDS